MERLEFRILGPLDVLAGGQPLPLGGPKQRSLLALLLVHAGEVVSRDRILDELWPEDAGSAEPKLHVSVSRLRKLLARGDEQAVVRGPHGYGLAIEDDQLDARRFERLVVAGRAALAEGDQGGARSFLADALALWRGPALADLAYESFAQAEIGRLEELRLAAIKDKLDAELALGHHTDALAQLDALVLQHPLDEELAARRILALYRSGRQAEALGAYDEARRALDELGLEPDRLEDLRARVRADRRDAHLGEHLEEALADRLDHAHLGFLGAHPLAQHAAAV